MSKHQHEERPILPGLRMSQPVHVWAEADARDKKVASEEVVETPVVETLFITPETTDEEIEEFLTEGLKAEMIADVDATLAEIQTQAGWVASEKYPLVVSTQMETEQKDGPTQVDEVPPPALVVPSQFQPVDTVEQSE